MPVEHAVDRARAQSEGSWAVDNRYSLIGAAAVIIGVGAAIASIPYDPQPSGALFWPALWLSLGVLSVPIFRASTDMSVVLRTEHFLMLGLFYWLLLDPVQGAYPLEGVSYDDVALEFIAIGMMALGIWIGSVGRGWSLPGLVLRAAKQSLNTKNLFVAAILTFCLGMFNFALTSGFDPSVMINGLSVCRFCAPWSRGAFGGTDAFAEHLQYFGYVLPSLTVMIAQQSNWVRVRTVVVATMSGVMTMFLAQQGGRRIIGVVVGAALITWVLFQARIRTRVVIGGLVVVACLLYGMEEMLRYRSTGFGGEGAWSAQEAEISRLHVDDNFLRLSQVVHLFPDVQPYVNLQPLVYALVRPIPRVLWEEKPSDPGYDFTTLAGESGVSLSHSIVGELYAMRGLLAVMIGGVLFGRLANMWNKLLLLQGGAARPMTYGFGVMVAFAGLRSMQDMVIMSYGLLGWFVIARFLPQPKATPAAPGIG
jgi:hypothetical protein